MSLYPHLFYLIHNRKDHHQGRFAAITITRQKLVLTLWVFFAGLQLSGCVSDKVEVEDTLAPYQQLLADEGPQWRVDTEGRDLEQPLGLLWPVLPPPHPESIEDTITDPNTSRQTVLGSVTTQLGFPIIQAPTATTSEREVIADPNISSQTDELPISVEENVTDANSIKETTLESVRGQLGLDMTQTPRAAVSYREILPNPTTEPKILKFTIEDVLTRALANSPEIRVVSFDPSIAKQDITRAASEFDFTTFGRVNFEQEDRPPNSIFQPGQSDVRAYEAGIKQRGVTGAEWSVSYALTRSWDDLVGRALPTRYEPVLSFQLKQPLLRDAWPDVTLAGVDIAKLNYKVALLSFRQKSEEVAAQVISAYWGLVQARRDAEIHQKLLDRTLETLNKVEGRRGIDATNVQVKQTESFVKIREASLLVARKAILDAQEVLVRLIVDDQLNVLDEFEIIPVSKASVEARIFEPSEVLEIAMRKNPILQQARVGVEIADINVRIAENQKMPRLDLVASTTTQTLAEHPYTAQRHLDTGDYVSYAIGLSLEIPLGNRQREVELIQRRLERRKAVATLQTVADQVAIAAKETLRRIKTNHLEIQVQKEAVEAARIHLQTLKDTEPIREQLTPEFLLVKLQAQETLANAQRAQIKAVVDFNVSLVELARFLGTVLELKQIKSSLPAVSSNGDALK